MVRPTLKDVAERAGVSRSAVSRTFTDGASVSAKMRRKVELAAQELGYSPNALASSLTTGRTMLIGLISNNFHNPLFLEIYDQVTRMLQDRGLRTLLVNLTDETDPRNSVRMMRQYAVDGVIVASSTLPPGFARAFREAGIPVVHSFGRFSSSPHVHVVGIDNLECGRMAAREIIGRGYTRPAFLGGPIGATSTQDRLEGYSDEVHRLTGKRPSYSFARGYSFEAGRAEMRRLIAETPADAYFCGDDVVAIGALSALRESGFDVPNDVGLIGLNDMEMSGWQNIDLTTIRQPIREIISSSVELMLATLENAERYPEARLFPCTVVERGTLRPKP